MSEGTKSSPSKASVNEDFPDLVSRRPVTANALQPKDATTEMIGGLSMGSTYEIEFESLRRSNRFANVLIFIQAGLIWGMLSFMMLTHRIPFPSKPGLWFAWIMLFLIVGAIPLGILWRNNFGGAKEKPKIILSHHEMLFSHSWSMDLIRRLNRTWDDVHSVQIYNRENFDIVAWKRLGKLREPLRLVIDFKSGGSAGVWFYRSSRQEIIKLFQAIETWMDPAKLSSEVVQLKQELLTGADSDLSFTRLWANDLESRYSTTHFVTLPPNHALQNGRYKIVTQLSSGGQSAAYLAATSNGERVVIKEIVMPLNTNDLIRSKACELLEREASLLTKLQHPCISRILDYFVERGRNYLVLEYISGPTLRQIVQKNGPIQATQAINWAVQIAEILDYLHTHAPPILHRDVTPDNIMLGSDGRIILIDFGAANEFIESATGTLIGKQSYISPEQFRGKAGPGSDIYSLGGTLHFLLIGQDPIPLAPTHPSQCNPEIPLNLDMLVAACTAQELRDRPLSAAEVVEQLNKLGDTNVGNVTC